MAKFGEAERHIATLLRVGNSFDLDGQRYTIANSGKPTCSKGEPKTDIYVLAKSENTGAIEIKISFKKENADFIENKTNSERAEILFGHNWKKVIMDATASISDSFYGKKLIFKAKSGRTEEGAITLGWKYELLNKTGGELSGIVQLTRAQIMDVYAGTHLFDDKKNATVNGNIIENSGIANCILMSDTMNSVQDVIDHLIPIEKYVDLNPTVYFACKALNYRTYCDKYDGNRPLSVFVDWKIGNNMLTADLVFDNPLNVKGDEVASKLKQCLNQLGISTTKDITDNLIKDPTIIHK